MASRRMLGWLGLLAAVAVAGCTAASTSSPARPDRPASPTATTAVSPQAGGVRNLAVNQDVRSELTVAYAHYRGISPAEVGGTRAGSVYCGYDPATSTYWAQANFAPSSTASYKTLVGFQDGASIGLFTRIGNGSWQVQLGGEPVACADVKCFPQAVLTAWSRRPDTASFHCDL